MNANNTPKASSAWFIPIVHDYFPTRAIDAIKLSASVTGIALKNDIESCSTPNTWLKAPDSIMMHHVQVANSIAANNAPSIQIAASFII